MSTGVAGPLRVVRQSAVVALADLRSVYTVKSWTFGWLTRMLAQVVVFSLIGTLLGDPARLRYLVVGNALMTCVVETMMVVASTSWERTTGTLPLLVAAPGRVAWVFAGRSVFWPMSGAATSVIALLGLAPLFGVRWSAAQVPVVVLLVLLTAATTYCVGLCVAGLTLSVSGLRNVASNVSYLSMMAVCGVVVPTDFWPAPVRALAAALPLTHSLAALRGLGRGDPAAALLGDVGWSLLLGAGWLIAAAGAFTAFVRSGRRAGSFDFGE